MKAAQDMKIAVAGTKQVVKKGDALPEFTTIQQISALNAQGLIDKPQTKKGDKDGS